MEKRIVLTKEELEILEQLVAEEKSGINIDRAYDPIIAKLINDATNLMDELQAYDEVGDSLIIWYYEKYMAQKN